MELFKTDKFTVCLCIYSTVFTVRLCRFLLFFTVCLCRFLLFFTVRLCSIQKKLYLCNEKTND